MAILHPDDLLAAYTLDALTEEERASVAAHITGCERCRSWIARHGPATEVFALSIGESPAPRHELRDRILAAAARTEQIRPGVAPTPIRTRAFGWSRVAGWLAAAALFLTAFGLGAWNYSLSLQNSSLRQQIAAMQPAPVLHGALLATADAPGALGSLAVRSGERPILSVSNLPPPKSGQVYEAWVINSSGAPRPAGTFATTPDGQGLFGLTLSPQPGEIVAITAEPSPGLAAPSGKILLKGTVSPGA